jgi:hypothetical protein
VSISDRVYENDPVHDENGVLITVGAIVTCGGEESGVVTKITDWDGDTDDEGKIIGYPPIVTVKFSEDVDEFPTHLDYYTEQTVCEDLIVVVRA